MAKIDSKVIIARLEFAAKAAEEFLRAFNQVKADIEQIRPLTPYQIKKKEKETHFQAYKIKRIKQLENHWAREEAKLTETMRTKGMSKEEAVKFLRTQNVNRGKQAWETRKQNLKKPLITDQNGLKN